MNNPIYLDRGKSVGKELTGDEIGTAVRGDEV
jgi:hypothetical protein